MRTCWFREVEFEWVSDGARELRVMWGARGLEADSLKAMWGRGAQVLHTIKLCHREFRHTQVVTD